MIALMVCAAAMITVCTVVAANEQGVGVLRYENSQLELLPGPSGRAGENGTVLAYASQHVLRHGEHMLTLGVDAVTGAAHINSTGPLWINGKLWSAETSTSSGSSSSSSSSASSVAYLDGAHCFLEFKPQTVSSYKGEKFFGIHLPSVSFVVLCQGTGPSTATEIRIWKWESPLYSIAAEPWQRIPVASTALDAEFFEISGEYFLAIRNDPDYPVYKFNPSTEKFDFAYNLVTNGATYTYDIAYFAANGHHFMVGVVYQKSGSYDVNADLLKYNPTSGRFAPHQNNIAIHGGWSAHPFVLHAPGHAQNGHTFVAIANSRSGSTTNPTAPLDIDSTIFHLNPTTNLLETFDTVPGHEATEFTSFAFGNTTYLVLSNTYSRTAGNTHDVNSEVFRFDVVSNSFVHHQFLPGLGATSADAFVIDGVQYVALANYKSSSQNTHGVNSYVYRWSSSTGTFALLQGLPVSGASSVRHIEKNGIHFLAFGSHRSPAVTPENFASTSKIFRWNPCRLEFGNA